MSGLRKLIYFVMIPLLIFMLVGMVLALTGHDRLATAVSNGGSALWMLGVLWWIALVDSRKRWPGVHWSQRFTRVLTFHRDQP